MIDIQHNIENLKAMKLMAHALEISENTLTTTNSGNHAIRGKENKPLKGIHHVKDRYLYSISGTSKRKQSAIKSKLTSFGMSEDYRTDGSLLLSMKRLPEPSEARFIRRLLGYKPTRKRGEHE